MELFDFKLLKPYLKQLIVEAILEAEEISKEKDKKEATERACQLLQDSIESSTRRKDIPPFVEFV